MHCFVEKLPSEIVVLVLQLVDGGTMDALMEAIPRLLESALIREYVGSRRTVCVEHCRHGLVAAGDSKEWVWSVMRAMKVVSPCTCKSSKKHCSINFIHLKKIQNMDRLQLLHVEQSDVVLITELLKYLPKSLEVLEVILTKPVKGKSSGNTATDMLSLVPSSSGHTSVDITALADTNITVTELGKHKTALRMITIVNESRWNRKKVFQSFGASMSVVKHDNGEWQRTWPKMKSGSTSVLFQLGTALGALLARSADTLQNVGIFGIDALWVMKEAVLNDVRYNKLRVVKVGGESLARSPLWIKYFQGERREFAYGIYMSPLVVVFSPMFNDRCKVIACSNRSNAVFVSGTGVDFLRKYTFI